MTAKDYLRRIRGMELDLKTIEDEIVTIESALTRVTPTYQTDGWVSSGSSNDKMTDGVCKLIEKKREYEKAWGALIDERERAEKILWKMECSMHRAILWWRYIKAERWERVAVETHLDMSWVHRRHGRALNEFQKIMEEK